MRIEVAATLLLVLWALPLAGQVTSPEDGSAGERRRDAGPSLLLVDQDTRVASVDFRYVPGSGIDPDRIPDHVAYTGPGFLAGARRALDVVPGISAPELEPFSPLTLQRDVARVRRLYRRSGYPDAAIDYDVQLDTASNEVGITFIVEPGEPIRLGNVSVTFPGDAASDPIPELLEGSWREYLASIQVGSDGAFGTVERAAMEDGTTDWLRQRGYPWARVRASLGDTVSRSVDVTLSVDPGPRARVDSVHVEGRERLDRAVLIRELPFDTGDWYDARAVSEGEREMYELDLVRRSLGDVPPQPEDSTVTLRYRIEESRPRLIWGRAGWRSEAGVSAEAHWSHRNFLGNARTFTASVTAETGWGAIDNAGGRLFGASVSVRRPYLWDRRISGTLGPFVRYRDDPRDRSLQFGIESALLYRRRALHTVTLQHELSRARVDQAYQPLPVSEIVESGDESFAPIFVRSVFSARGSYGKLDDRLAPTSGFVVEPRVDATGPMGLSQVDYARISLDALAATRLGHDVDLLVTASAGRLFPYGDSDPVTSDSPTRAVVGLRDAMFTAGGTSDLRGWGRGMAGPKTPEIIVGPDGAVRSERYLPVGGLARVASSVELALPFPFLSGDHGTFVFLDAGRVWSPDPGFDPGDPELALDPWLFSTGAGVQFSTIAGPIRLAVGYKLNPTVVDLLSPQRTADALLNGIDLDGLEPDHSRRWHLHLAIGRGL